MMGWEIFITHGEQQIASWMTGGSGTDWLRNLVKQGKAKDLGANGGFPHAFSMEARVLRPILIEGIPQSGSGITVGENFVIASRGVWNLKINFEALMQCQDDDVLEIDAWDQD
jgi:hypothetical protein